MQIFLLDVQKGKKNNLVTLRKRSKVPVKRQRGSSSPVVDQAVEDDPCGSIVTSTKDHTAKRNRTSSFTNYTSETEIQET